jgi:hypothetical protein
MVAVPDGKGGVMLAPLTTAAAVKRNAGDIVGLSHDNYPGRWQVVEIKGPKNVVLKPLEGQSGRNLRAPKDMLTDAPEPTASGVVGVGKPFREMRTLWPGELCVSSHKDASGKLLVVTADKWEKINCVELGGRGGRYWRLPYQTVTPLDADQAIDYLIGAIDLTLAMEPDSESDRDQYRALLALLTATRSTPRE